MEWKFSFYRISIIILGFAASLNTLTAAPFNICGEPVLQIGWFTATQGKSQHINIEGLIGDDFSVDRSARQNLLIGVGYYLNWLDISQICLKYGINAFYLGPTKVSGRVTQEDLFTNLSYHYSRTNYPIYLATKALFPCFACSELVIDLGIGPNIVNTGSFKERSLDGGITEPDRRIFSGKTDVTFSATAGLGWRLNIFGNRSIELDYRFFYLGQGKLKKVNSQVKSHLKTGNSYANALFISISI